LAAIWIRDKVLRYSSLSGGRTSEGLMTAVQPAAMAPARGARVRLKGCIISKCKHDVNEQRCGRYKVPGANDKDGAEGLLEHLASVQDVEQVDRGLLRGHPLVQLVHGLGDLVERERDVGKGGLVGGLGQVLLERVDDRVLVLADQQVQCAQLLLAVLGGERLLGRKRLAGLGNDLSSVVMSGR